MRRLIAMLAVLALPVAWAAHFTGTYVDQQAGVTLVLQQQQDGTMQGQLTGPSGQFQLQGQGNEQGAFGTVQSSQGILGFQAQLSQDNMTLQLVFFQADQNNQPVQVGAFALQRGGGPTQPGIGQPGQTPGMGQPGMGQPGQAPGMAPPPGFPGQPGMTGVPQTGQPTPPPGAIPVQPGMTQPGLPGVGQPGAGQPGMGQPGMGQPGMGGMPVGGWDGTYVGNAGQLQMVIQSAGQAGTYVGYFVVSGQQFQLQATGGPEFIEGVFIVNGSQVPFYAEVFEGGVYLVDGRDGTEYILEPLNGGPGAAPGAAPARSPLGGQ